MFLTLNTVLSLSEPQFHHQKSGSDDKFSWLVMSNCFGTPWIGIFPGKNTGVDCHFLLQGVFPTKGSNPRLNHISCLPLLHCRKLFFF